MKNISLALLLASCCVYLSCKKEKQEQIITTTHLSYSPNPLFIYYFNGNLADSSGNNLSLDASSSINYGYVNDRKNNANKALTFNNGYVKLPASTLYKVQFPFTVSFWTNVNDSASSNNRFIYSDGNNNYYGFWIQTYGGSNGKLAFNFGDGGAPTSTHRNTAVSSISLTSNTWNHVVAIFKGANDFEVYINNVKDNTLTYEGAATTIEHTGTAGLIGAYPGGSSFLDGKIDNIKFWTRILSAQEVQTEYTNVK